METLIELASRISGPIAVIAACISIYRWAKSVYLKRVRALDIQEKLWKRDIEKLSNLASLATTVSKRQELFSFKDSVLSDARFQHINGLHSTLTLHLVSGIFTVWYFSGIERINALADRATPALANIRNNAVANAAETMPKDLPYELISYIVIFSAIFWVNLEARKLNRKYRDKINSISMRFIEFQEEKISGSIGVDSNLSKVVANEGRSTESASN